MLVHYFRNNGCLKLWQYLIYYYAYKYTLPFPLVCTITYLIVDADT